MQRVQIWYAAYGSNLLEERFLAYLRGGNLAGSQRPHHGARDAGDPAGSQPYRLDRPMGFGFESRRWNGGGVSFVDPNARAPQVTLGRAWLITVEQFEDVWAQENGRATGPAIDVDALVATGAAECDHGSYRRLLYLGELDGQPVATITCDPVPAPNPAGATYLDIVGRGLMETWSLSPTEAARYLATRIGNEGTVDEDALADQLGDRSP